MNFELHMNRYPHWKCSIWRFWRVSRRERASEKKRNWGIAVVVTRWGIYLLARRGCGTKWSFDVEWLLGLQKAPRRHLFWTLDDAPCGVELLSSAPYTHCVLYCVLYCHIVVTHKIQQERVEMNRRKGGGAWDVSNLNCVASRI